MCAGFSGGSLRKLKEKIELISDEVIFVVTRLVRPGCEQQLEDRLGRMSEAELKLSGFLGRETFSQQHSRGSGRVLDHADTRTSVYRLVAARFNGSFARHQNRYGDIDRRDIAILIGAIQLDIAGLT